MEVNAVDSSNVQVSTPMSLKQKEHIELYSFEKGLGKDQRIDIEPIEIIIKIKCPEHQKAEIKNKIINTGIQNCVYVFE